MPTIRKDIYFVRHAESLGNVAEIQQHAEIDLSENGHGQASSVAERFLNISIDIVIASDMLRAQKTARAIAEKTKKELVLSALFHERKRPSETKGLWIGSDEAQAVQNAIIEHADDPAWHYSDEENYFDLRERARKAIHYLEERKEKTLAVVTHGVFLKMLIATMLNPDILPREFLRLASFLFPQNTGITWCQKGHPKAVDKNIWQMVTWNDHSHLG